MELVNLGGPGRTARFRAAGSGNDPTMGCTVRIPAIYADEVHSTARL
jgi:hypothetical protein